MRYLLDTDHLSILQRQKGEDYRNLSRRMAPHLPSDFVISIVTLHEQILGSHTYISRARNQHEVIKGYEIMGRILSDFKVLPTIGFDMNASTEYAGLASQRIQLATMDARIAAIALSRQLVLLTRNSRDFSKVSGLIIEDWTVSF
ncbi:type II toxin-antitoxin system VapC family toxin [Acaryochloris sp. 'Moss Beach']|uniref:type II toxin-antitoxin system VapC family toxin n=1 Tax=Acaryochloris sp. 'Moss Beach' TaxID=2740837 RepID=UPI001F31CBB5|nr:type II toxin-antitoxin system VapC family toxin [Acaryochloris sp. 'Moss Beach']UJB68125.1 type II toxin-antitoxin system VapC family toxin [Acaryochloris sp. 'Moss Beach']